MSTSLVLHDVEKITLKRASVKGPDGRDHNWTTLIITHRASGYDAGGEYAHVLTESEITLHHPGLPKVPFKIERKPA